jgi:hypothetical protein
MTDEANKPAGDAAHVDTKLTAAVTGQTTNLNPDNLSPATKPEASGALQEPEIAARIDLNHPAVDSNPREGLPARSNQIDFNDPTISGHEAVRRNLEAQGINSGPAHDDVSRKD